MKGISTLKKIGKAAVVFAIGIAGTLITDKASDKLVNGIKNYKNDSEDTTEDAIDVIDVNDFVEDDSEDTTEDAEETED